MRKIYWREFRPADMSGLIWERWYENQEHLFRPPAYTGICEGKIVACAGIQPLWSGVGEAWIAVCPDAHLYTGLPGAIKDILEYVEKVNAFHRVQASVRADDLVALRLDRWLGFQAEGIMRKFGPDEADYIRLARVV
jgi:RimJ/RimL family protein N-acetyltransferase